jgi:hypothetical protein
VREEDGVHPGTDGLEGERRTVAVEDAGLRDGSADEGDPPLQRRFGDPLDRADTLDLLDRLDRPHPLDGSFLVDDDRVERFELTGEGEREGRRDEDGTGGEVRDHVGGRPPARLPGFDVLDVACLGSGYDCRYRFADCPLVLHLRDDDHPAFAGLRHVGHRVGGAEPGEVAHVGVRRRSVCRIRCCSGVPDGRFQSVHSTNSFVETTSTFTTAFKYE